MECDTFLNPACIPTKTILRSRGLERGPSTIARIRRVWKEYLGWIVSWEVKIEGKSRIELNERRGALLLFYSLVHLSLTLILASDVLNNNGWRPTFVSRTLAWLTWLWEWPNTKVSVDTNRRCKSARQPETTASFLLGGIHTWTYWITTLTMIPTNRVVLEWVMSFSSVVAGMAIWRFWYNRV